jgi:subtilase family serine protease
VGLGGLSWSSWGQGVAGKPELHPLSLALQPASPVALGQEVTVTVMVENRSPRGVRDSGVFSVGFYFRLLPEKPDMPRPEWTLFDQAKFDPGLASNAMAERSVVLDPEVQIFKGQKLSEDKVVEVRVLVDFKSEVDEQDERNNELVQVLSIRSASTLRKPDASPVEMRFDCASTAGAVLSPAPCPLGARVDEIRALRVTAVVANLGDAPLPGDFETRLALCRVADERSKACLPPAQRPQDEDRVKIIRAPAAGLIKAGERVERSAVLDFTQEPPLRPGIYRVEALVITPESVAERDRANNALVVFYRLSGPELRPISLEFQPSVLLEHGVMTVVVKVINEGFTNVDRPFSVAFFANGRAFGGDDPNDTRTISTLNAGATAEFKATLFADKFDLKADQLVTIQAIVDPENAISELDESNNALESQLTVQKALPQRPELWIKSLTVPSPFEKEKIGTALPPGPQTVRLTAQILNTGPLKAQGVRVCFFFRPSTSVVWEPIDSDTCTGARALDLAGQMDPLTSKGIDATAELPIAKLQQQPGSPILGGSPGSYQVRAVVDPQNQITELDELNNEIVSHLLLIRPIKPDLISALRLPAQPVNFGSRFPLRAIVTNAGDDVVTQPFAVQFTAQHFELRAPQKTIGISQVREFQGRPISASNPLRPGQSIEITVEVQSGETALLDLPGFYLFEVIADPPSAEKPDGQIDEQDETNNSSQFRPDAAQPGAFKINGPNLAVALNGICVRATPEGACNERLSFTSGESLFVTATVENRGTLIAGPFNVDIRLCRGLFNLFTFECAETLSTGTALLGALEPLNPLNPGQGTVTTRLIELSTRGLPGGTYQVVVVVDPATTSQPFGRVREELELDNVTIFERPIEISGPNATTPPFSQGIDLRVASLTLIPDLVTIPRGRTVQVRAVIQNIGRNNAGSFRVSFAYRRARTLQGETFSLQRVNALASGQSVTLQADLETLGLAPGEYELVVTADAFNEILEDDEFNNTFVRPVTIQ